MSVRPFARWGSERLLSEQGRLFLADDDAAGAPKRVVRSGHVYLVPRGNEVVIGATMEPGRVISAPEPEAIDALAQFVNHHDLVAKAKARPRPDWKPFQARPEKTRSETLNEAETTRKMLLREFDKAKGFGFANVFGRPEDVFIHIEVLRVSGFADLQAGEAICLRIVEGKRGRMAVQVVSWEAAARGQDG